MPAVCRNNAPAPCNTQEMALPVLYTENDWRLCVTGGRESLDAILEDGFVLPQVLMS